MAKQTARVVVKGNYSDDESSIRFNGECYDVDISSHIAMLIEDNKLNLTEENNFILVPHTIGDKEDIQYLESKEQVPYLRFTIIGVPKNQANLIYDEVNIIGKVIYENVNHEFVMVKIKYAYNKHEILKLNGLLENAGNAREKIYEIKAFISGKSLYIEDSKCLQQSQNSNVVYMKDHKKNYNIAA